MVLYKVETILLWMCLFIGRETLNVQVRSLGSLALFSGQVRMSSGGYREGVETWI